MQAVFGLAREKDNKLYYKEYQNDKGIFHFHSSIELYFIDEGEMEVLVNDRKKLLTAGQMSVALSYNPHGYKTPEGSRSAVLIIPSAFCREFLERVKDKRPAFPFITDADTVATLREFARQIGRNDIDPIKRNGYIYLVLGTLLEALSFETSAHSSDTDLASALLLAVNEGFRQNISLKELAVLFGYSESYISRYFKDNFGVGFNEYINLLRLRCALELINEKKHSITYCAMESGFSSMRTFYRCFKEEFGCTPKQATVSQ